VVVWKGWKINPMICYDLRFPVWCKNEFSEPDGFLYDIQIFVANWPKARVSAWDALLKARAIENSAYVVGLNRVGEDGNNIPYNGHSAVYDPKGEIVADLGENDETKIVELNQDDLARYRQRFQVQLDWDKFNIL
jgi:predicted amidohydrolase